MIKPLAAVALLLLATPVAAQSVFKCTDAQTGAVEFTDEPCSEEQTTEQIEVQPGTVVSSEQVYKELDRIEAEKAAAQAKEQAEKQKQQGDQPYPDIHPAAGALNKIKTLMDTLKAPFGGE